MSRRNNPYARPDRRTLEARSAGYPARSVFKLEEIDRRCHLLRRGARVLDLGAAPGSWSLYASQRVGREGKILAVDLSVIKTTLPSNVVVVRGDALDVEGNELARFAPYDVVMSDMAPRTSGTKVRDKIHSFELCMGALRVAQHLGKPASHFVAKIFMSGDFPEAKLAVSKHYDKTRVIKPEGTRTNSTEVFLVGLALRGDPPSGD